MNTLQPLGLSIGATSPPLHTGPIRRHRFAMYTHGSGDLSPIHVDPDHARDKAGLPDVIVHGMSSMGQLSRLLTRWAGQGSVRSFDTRFAAMLPVMASLQCEGVIEAVQPADGGSLVTVKLSAVQGDGTAVATGSAWPVCTSCGGRRWHCVNASTCWPRGRWAPVPGT